MCKASVVRLLFGVVCSFQDKAADEIIRRASFPSNGLRSLTSGVCSNSDAGVTQEIDNIFTVDFTLGCNYGTRVCNNANKHMHRAHVSH